MLRGRQAQDAMLQLQQRYLLQPLLQPLIHHGNV
jgi:hypothetical protein